MNDISELPKGYTLAPKGAEYTSQDGHPIYWLGRVTRTHGPAYYKWSEWGLNIFPLSWEREEVDHPEGPFFAIPKPRYQVPLEVSDGQELSSPDRQ